MTLAGDHAERQNREYLFLMNYYSDVSFFRKKDVVTQASDEEICRKSIGYDHIFL
jgi:hypothetical protein